MAGTTTAINLAAEGWAPQTARKIWATLGAEFFRALAEHLAQLLGADYVEIAELLGTPADRLKTLAVWEDGAQPGDLERLLAGTPSAIAVATGACVYKNDVEQLFPTDPLIERTRAEAYAATTLLDSGGRPAGIIVALFRHPLEDDARVTVMLAEVAPRAASELGRKRAEDVLRQSEQRYRAFIAQSTDAMWRIEFEQPVAVNLPEYEQIERMDCYGYLAECNDALAHLLGAPGADQLIGARFNTLLPLSDPQIVEELLSAIRSGYRASSVEIRSLDSGGNPTYRIRSYWGIVENGALCRVWGTTRDIGELRRAEIDRHASERRFRHVLENVRLAALMLDSEGCITFANDYVLSLTGWPAEEVIGENWFDRMTPEHEREELKAAFRDAIAGPRAYHHFESSVLTRDGTVRLVAWDSTTLRDSEGKTAIGVAIVGRDITEQLALEAKFRQAQKLETAGSLADGVAHDFNNLLTIIRGYADLLLTGLDIGDPRRGAVEEIGKAGEAGAALTRQLLTFSRKQPLSIQRLNLNDTIAKNLNMLRSLIGEDVELICNLSPSPWFVVADSTQIFQVLMNLAVNARDAMPRGGKLFLTTANLEADQQSAAGMSGIRPIPYVVLTVSDTGLGMTEEIRARVFEPFFTTKQPEHGTGLGLSTVYEIVQQSGGLISVLSELGKGATFRILLPMASTEGAAVETAVVAGPVAGGTETILLVESREDVRAPIAAMLRSLHYRVLEAAGAGEALSVVKAHAEPVHLLLWSISIAGMAATELVAQLKAAWSEIRVLYMSANNPPLADEPWIQKPFTLQGLGGKVRELLDRAKPAQPEGPPRVI